MRLIKTIRLLIFPCSLVVFASGCGTTLVHMYGPPKNPIYSGARGDCGGIADISTKTWAESIGCLIDLPFSLAEDTLILPLDGWAYYDATRDPLKGWTYREFPVVGKGISATTTNTLPKAVIADYESYIAKNKLIPVESIFGFYENGQGQYAVKFRAEYALASSYNYALFYNNENKRIKVVKYNYNHNPC